MTIKRIRKPILTLLVCVVCSFLMQGQNTRAVFGKIPNELVLPIDHTKRLDLMDLYDAGKKAQVVNSLNDTCTLEVFSPDFLLLRTGQSTLEMAILPMINESKIVCVINTVCAPICDSRIAFYTTNWKPLDANLFFTPALADWFIRKDTNSVSFETSQYLTMSLMQYHIDIDKLTLTQTYTTPLYLGAMEKKKTNNDSKIEPKVFTWNNIQFK